MLSSQQYQGGESELLNLLFVWKFFIFKMFVQVNAYVDARKTVFREESVFDDWQRAGLICFDLVKVRHVQPNTVIITNLRTVQPNPF